MKLHRQPGLEGQRRNLGCRSGTARIRAPVSKVRPQKVNLNNVLGALLNNQQGTTAQNQYASIYTRGEDPATPSRSR